MDVRSAGNRASRARGLVQACIACALAGGCSDDPAPRPPPLDPLPPPASVATDRFADSARCGQCHTASATALRDASGRDVSPVHLWRASMMALAARDPYYLAVFAEDRAHNATAADRACTRCHAPAGSEESERKLGFDDLVAATDPAATLGREGVTCTLCHQIAARNLGEDASFSGNFTTEFGRTMYGPHANPFTDPMRMFVSYTPALGDHVATSGLCATCHTVIVGSVLEQATFLEWRSSSVASTKTCQSCHVPADDEDGTRVATAIAKFPADLSPRAPVGRHTFVGGNAYMLRALAAAEDWAQTGVAGADLSAAAAASEAHLATAARLEVALRPGELAVTVHNETGHKLPTGYPSRRMWLHVTITSGGAVVYESGAPAADGSLSNDRELVMHRDRITAPDQVQIWQAVLVDATGAPTHRALAATGYGKDDRILPAGFAPSSTDRARIAAIGVADDTDFIAGSDTVTYAIGDVPAGAAIVVELLYQSLTPAIVDAIDAARTPAGTRFVDLAREQPLVPIVIAHTETTR